MSISNYSQNVLFGLGYLYIQLYKPERAEIFLACLHLIDPEHKEARILLSVSQVMQGRKITVEEFNFARRYAPPVIAQMLARRTNVINNTKKNITPVSSANVNNNINTKI
jgi:hypothetical protein